MSEHDRDAQIDHLCQLGERGGSQRLLLRDGARLRFGSSKEAHEKRMVVGVMVASLLAAVTVPLLFLPVPAMFPAALGLGAAVMIALVIVPLVGHPPVTVLDLDERTVTLQKGRRTLDHAQGADVKAFFHKQAQRGDLGHGSASVSLRLSGDRAGRTVVLVNGLEVSAARETRDLVLALLANGDPDQAAPAP